MLVFFAFPSAMLFSLALAVLASEHFKALTSPCAQLKCKLEPQQHAKNDGRSLFQICIAASYLVVPTSHTRHSRVQ